MLYNATIRLATIFPDLSQPLYVLEWISLLLFDNV
jgi:hypothetical protein